MSTPIFLEIALEFQSFLGAVAPGPIWGSIQHPTHPAIHTRSTTGSHRSLSLLRSAAPLTKTLILNQMEISNDDNLQYVLKKLREKSSGRPIFAHLNIDSISSKFEPLFDIV